MVSMCDYLMLSFMTTNVDYIASYLADCGHSYTVMNLKEMTQQCIAICIIVWLLFMHMQ